MDSKTVKAPTKLKPGDLLEALEFVEPQLREFLTKKYCEKEWQIESSNLESPVVDRMIRKFGIFGVSLERLYACEDPPHFKLRRAPGLFKMHRGRAEVGVSELPPNGNPVISTRFILELGSCMETLSQKEYYYIRPLTQEIFISSIYLLETKFIEPPGFKDMSQNKKESLRKEFTRIFL